jgi:hypothetical protein
MAEELSRYSFARSCSRRCRKRIITIPGEEFYPGEMQNETELSSYGLLVDPVPDRG